MNPSQLPVDNSASLEAMGANNMPMPTPPQAPPMPAMRPATPEESMQGPDSLSALRSAMPGNIASGVVSNVPTAVPAGGDGHKRQLLQKLISNLLNKPGRSMHEMINGVKDAIGAYKNYAKEWDSLSGMGMGAMGGGAAGAGVKAATGGADIQKILRGIQEKKGGMPQPQPMTPPASMGGAMDAQGGPGFGMGISLPAQAPGLSRAQTNMDPHATAALIAGQPQTSTFNRPAPVNHLGMFGY